MNQPSVAFRARMRDALLAFVVGAALMYGVYGRGAVGVPGNDSFYHLKMAAMLPDVGLLREFPWLRFVYFTDEGQGFVSHHYGFHVLLAPFVYASQRLTGDGLAGGRWAICLFFGAVFVVFHRLVLDASRHWGWLWLPLFALLPFQFFTRHAFVRAISPSVFFMLLTVLFLFRRRNLLLALTIAVYIHVYMGAILYVPVIVAAYVLSQLWVGVDCRRVNYRVLLWSIAGWAAGIATHPYRDGMWEFLRLQVLGSGLSPDIAVGKEWKPYSDLWWFVQMSGIMVGAWLTAVLLRLGHGRPLDAKECTLFLLNIGFGLLTAKARRFIEYWPMFCLLSAVYLAAPTVDAFVTRLENSLSERGLRRGSMLGGILVAAAIVLFSPNWTRIRQTAKTDFDLPAVQSAMAFVQEHSAPGEVVFTDDWDIFPVFFYFNSHNDYIVGLDPKFTHARRPDLWERYVKITRGQIPAKVTVAMTDRAGRKVHESLDIGLEDIREHFGAAWVITDRDHASLASKLAEDTDFAELLYPSTSYSKSRDAPYLVFRIRAKNVGGTQP